MKGVFGSMEKNFGMILLTRAILILIAALPTYFFYNNIIAWNFNFPQFSYWEIVFGLVSGWMIRCALARFPED